MKRVHPVTHTISIIRNRGQLTIPDSIRALRNWTRTNSAVAVTSERPDEIIIKPFKKQYDWDKIRELIKRARAIKGKGEGSASEFLERDRRSH